MKKNHYVSVALSFLSILFLQACNQNIPNTETEVTEITTIDSVATLEATIAKPIKDTAKTATQKPLKLTIDHIKASIGEIEIGVYTPNNKFPDEDDKFKKYRFKAKKGKIVQLINDLPYGELAMAIYHDENNNGVIDKNGIGIPKEPYAFSNNYKPTIKAPSFDNCKFSYNKQSNSVHISLLK